MQAGISATATPPRSRGGLAGCLEPGRSGQDGSGLGRFPEWRGPGSLRPGAGGWKPAGRPWPECSSTRAPPCPRSLREAGRGPGCARSGWARSLGLDSRGSGRERTSAAGDVALLAASRPTAVVSLQGARALRRARFRDFVARNARRRI